MILADQIAQKLLKYQKQEQSYFGCPYIDEYGAWQNEPDLEILETWFNSNDGLIKFLPELSIKYNDGYEILYKNHHSYNNDLIEGLKDIMNQYIKEIL